MVTTNRFREFLDRADVELRPPFGLGSARFGAPAPALSLTD